MVSIANSHLQGSKNRIFHEISNQRNWLAHHQDIVCLTVHYSRQHSLHQALKSAQGIMYMQWPYKLSGVTNAALKSMGCQAHLPLTFEQVLLWDIASSSNLFYAIFHTRKGTQIWLGSTVNFPEISAKAYINEISRRQGCLATHSFSMFTWQTWVLGLPSVQMT